MEKARRPARPKKRPVQYRHELKYYINRGDYEILSRRLRSCIQQDENAQRNGGEYFIRSLYFDSPFDDALWEKLAGVNDRDKFRIRAYNGSDDVIRNAFSAEPKDNSLFLPKVMSRKKQIIPMLTALWG